MKNKQISTQATINTLEMLSILGYKVKDRVTGFKGVVISISFDLPGCVQAIVNPGLDTKKGVVGDPMWFDVNRLEIISDNPVMTPPKFVATPIPYVDFQNKIMGVGMPKPKTPKHGKGPVDKPKSTRY